MKSVVVKINVLSLYSHHEANVLVLNTITNINGSMTLLADGGISSESLPHIIADVCYSSVTIVLDRPAALWQVTSATVKEVFLEYSIISLEIIFLYLILYISEVGIALKIEALRSSKSVESFITADLMGWSEFH